MKWGEEGKEEERKRKSEKGAFCTYFVSPQHLMPVTLHSQTQLSSTLFFFYLQDLNQHLHQHGTAK
jgi:hypothetical protein